MGSRSRKLALTLRAAGARQWTLVVCVLALAAWPLAAHTPPAAASPTITEYSAVPPGSSTGVQPLEITSGPDGNIWFTDVGGVYRMIATGPTIGQVTEFPLSNGATGIVSADGALWFTDSDGIGCITTGGTMSEFPVTGGAAANTDAITVGPDGDLWFTEVGANEIGKAPPATGTPCTLTGPIAKYPLPGGVSLGTTGGGNPQTVADSIVGWGGSALIFAEPGSDSLGQMSTSGAYVATFPLTGRTPLTGAPYGVTAGPLGAGGSVWFTEGGNADVIGRLDPAVGFTQEYPLPDAPTGAFGGQWSIVQGPDGNLWFTFGAGSDNAGLGCITPSGATAQYPAPTVPSNPDGIAVGPDGAIWFTEIQGSKIGRLAPAACGAGAPGGPPGGPPGPSGPPGSTSPPQITGTAQPGHTFTCAPGSWSQDPTAYTYQWYRDGTLLAGATGPSYAVGQLDEGATLACVVTATNARGSTSASSPRRKVPLPHVPGCPGATGRMTGTTIGQITLGISRVRARYLYRRHSDRGRRYEDFFCLTPIGVRVGYASPRLLRSLPAGRRRALAGRVVWASTSDPYYSLDGVRAGESVVSAARALGAGPPLRIGLNLWYLARRPGYTAVLKVRAGVVQELGIASSALTGSARASGVLMRSFY